MFTHLFYILWPFELHSETISYLPKKTKKHTHKKKKKKRTKKRTKKRKNKKKQKEKKEKKTVHRKDYVILFLLKQNIAKFICSFWHYLHLHFYILVRH
jgi:transposase